MQTRYSSLIAIFFLPVLVLAGVLWSLPLKPADAEENLAHTYPKLANLYLGSPLTESIIRDLARWDVVILHMADQLNFASQIRELRRLNPDIKILAYIPSQEFPITQYAAWETNPNGPWHKLLAGITADMWLTDNLGNHQKFWFENWMLNNTNYPTKGIRWNEYLANFMSREILATNLWDGIFYDNTWPSISWIKNMQADANRDGLNDTPPELDKAWEEGMQTLFTLTRQKAGREIIILGNGDRGFQNQVNGFYIENFANNGYSYWSDHMRYYKESVNSASPRPRVAIVGATSPNGNSKDYKNMRYGLTSALLENGYFAFDARDNHADIWWYDEYNSKLGEPAGEAVSVRSGAADYTGKDAWRREYQTGVALVNPTPERVDIDLGGEYEKLIGTQDKVVNDGAIVTNVSIEAHDGLIMLKTLEKVKNVMFINGAFTRFFTKNGQRARNGLFLFEDGVPGGAKIFNGDLDGDATHEKIIVSGAKMKILDNQGRVWYNDWPLGANYKGVINVALSNINNEFSKTIVVTGSRGGKVVVFNYYGALVKEEIYPLGKKYSQGFSAAVAGSGPNGQGEIILTTLRGPKTEVLFYSLSQNKIVRRFAPYGQFYGGAFVAAGNFSGGSQIQVATTALVGGRPTVRVFDLKGKKISEFKLSGFFSGLLGIAASDVNFGGHDEIVIFSNN
ncbi:MAG: putative glycoside hydrolase [Candidatus Magasanikbacteria bacterium]|nr:putative glycoside hydrolase [Candidatus Magasanikbacteria bacterium]